MTAELPVGLAARLRMLVGLVGAIVSFSGVDVAAAQARFTQWPSISITSPVSGSSYQTNEAAVSLAGTAQDNADVVRVTWSNSRGGRGEAAGTENWSVADIALATGINYLVVTAHDAGGRRRSAWLTVSRSGQESAPADTPPAKDTTAPTVPGSLRASAMSSNQINLSWAAATDNIGVTGYRLERCQASGCTSFRPIGTASGTSYTDAGLISGTSYSYRVQAMDAAGNVSSYSGVSTADTGVNNSPPVISGTPVRSVVSGVAYSFTPTASDPDGQPLTFSASGAPSWSTFSTSTGRLAGTPGAANVGVTQNIVISVSDGITRTSLPVFSLEVLPASVAKPTVTLTAAPGSVSAGQQTKLTWSSANASSCTASGGWNGTKGPSGDQLVGPLSSSTSFTLNCAGEGGSASATTTVALLAATANALYVAGAQANASDSNPGTESQPWKTVAHAARTAKAGDTVYIKAATYNGNVSVANSGEAGKEIVFRAYPGDERRAVIEGGNFLIKAKAYITVRGLKFQNIPGEGISIRGPDDWRQPPVHHINIDNNHFFNTESSAVGVWGVLWGTNPGDWENAADIVIQNNLIEKAVNGGYDECITVANGARRVEVRYNELRNGGDSTNGGEGIDFKEGVKDSSIHHNFIHGLTRTGIYIDGGRQEGAKTSNIRVFNNTTLNDPNDSIFVMSEGAGDVDGVYLYNNLVINSAKNGMGVHQHPDGVGIGQINNVQFANNTVIRGGRKGTGWGGIGITMPEATNIVIRNNIVQQGNGFDIRVEAASYTVDHNLCRNSSCESHGDPMFVNPTLDPATWDYRLKAGSAAMDWGSTLGAPTEDLDGVARPQGAAIDLGAYEYLP